MLDILPNIPSGCVCVGGVNHCEVEQHMVT